MIEYNELQDIAELLDSFLTEIDSLEYCCPVCGDREDLNKVFDMSEGREALDRLYKILGSPK